MYVLCSMCYSVDCALRVVLRACVRLRASASASAYHCVRVGLCCVA